MTDRGDPRGVTVAVLALAVVTGTALVGANVSALISHGVWLTAGWTDALAALPRLLAHPSEPAAAWPVAVRDRLPGPVVYWSATLLVVVSFGAIVAAGWVRWGSAPVGTRRRRRLGVDTRGRFATRRELRRLRVASPMPGRFTLGRVHGRLVATEHPDAPSPNAFGRTSARGGNRSAVAVIGPSQCGKTSNVVCSILEWHGPAILSSVKGDLVEQTGGFRATLGNVYVFDPLHELDDDALPKDAIRCGWSPLQSATTIGGAMAVANALLDAAPNDGMTNASFWSRKGEALLWPVLFAAAISGGSMADVIRWLALQDGDKNNAEAEPGNDGVSQIRTILMEARQGSDVELAKAGAFALQQFNGFWMLNDRVRSDVFSTAQTLVQPWEDPRLAASSASEPLIDLGALLRDGRANTLYLSQPLKGADRLSVVFGGLLGDLLAEQAYEIAKRAGCALPDLLVVIDEAGNTPVRWLPQVASTCSGIGVVLVTVWQSKSQIDARYQVLADSVLTNHATKIIFSGSSDESTGKYAAFLAGDEEVENRSRTDGATSRSTATNTTRLAMLPASVLRRADAGHALLVHRTLPPAHLRSRHLASEPTLRALATARPNDTRERPDADDDAEREGARPPAAELAPRLAAALEAMALERARRLRRAG